MSILIWTTLPHFIAILPLLFFPDAQRYIQIIAISTTFSVLYHTYHESNRMITFLDYLMATLWSTYDIYWGLTMPFIDCCIVLLLNGLALLANQSISYDTYYPARHSFWHLFSACKCICISMMIRQSLLIEPFKAFTTNNSNMAFVQAMSAPATKWGVNGAEVYVDTGDTRVTLFSMLNRGLEASYLQEHIHTIFQQNNPEQIRDVWVMAFQTRDIRGGKGERKLFYQFIETLYEVDPQRTIAILSLIPEYGCWRDLWEIWQRIPALEGPILVLIRDAYLKNVHHFHLGEQEKMDLLAKWLPREKSKTFPGLGRKIANFIYASEGPENKRLMMYRTLSSKMNEALKTVEINMCGKKWATIEPSAVPGRSLKIHDKAFLNIKKGDEIRFPNDADRMICREHFQKFLEDVQSGKKKAHGANVVMPHELIVKAEDNTIGKSEWDLLQAQWDSIKEECLQQGGLGRCLAMCDFSGSMSGTPLEVSKALGLLISEINHPAFRDHILTFDAVPQWHSFVGKKTVQEKLATLRNCGQGLNTDFYKACRCVLDRMVKYKVPVGEEPEDLIVITDMGFDDASACHPSSVSQSWESQLQRIRREFKEAGEWKPPRIVIWNVRAAYKDFHATADQEGVVQLSGWSPSMLKALQKGIQVQTPYQGMRSVLDDARYDAVRAQL